MHVPEALLILTFVSILVLVTLEKIEKGFGGLLGATMVFLILFVSDESFVLVNLLSFINFEVILTILAIFTSVNVIRKSGLFQWLAIKGIKATKGEAYPLFILLCLVSSLFSGFITAIAVMVIIGNLTIDVAKVLNISPTPYLVAEAIVVKLGGLLTPISGILNIIISGELPAASFYFFAVRLIPLFCLLVPVTILVLLRQFKVLEEPVERRRVFLMEVNPWMVVPNKWLLKSAATLFIAMIASFIILSKLFVRVELWLVAVIFMLIFLSLPHTKAKEVFRDLDWGLLFFLIGLFILVEGLNQYALLSRIAEGMVILLQENKILSILALLWFSYFASGIINSLAVTVVLIPIVQQLLSTEGLAAISPILITALIISVNLGSNLTPMASVTTVIAMSLTRKTKKEFSSKEFFKIGFLISFLHLSIVTVYLSLVFLFTYFYSSSIAVINLFVIGMAIGSFAVLYFQKRGHKKVRKVLSKCLYYFSKLKKGIKDLLKKLFSLVS